MAPFRKMFSRPGQLGMKAGADLQQARHAAVEIDVAERRRRDARQDLEERAFARAVGADDPDDVADARRRRSRRAAPRNLWPSLPVRADGAVA